MNTLYFRVDTNITIATGHIMRCLSIAQCARDNNINCCFIVADEQGEQFVLQRGFEVHCLHTDWQNKEQELPVLLEFLKERNAKVCMIDSYQVTDTYMKELRMCVKVIYIDDMDLLRTPVDVLINYNNYGNTKEFREKYEKHVTDTKTACLLGCGYTPLREEFLHVEPLFAEEVTDVLVSTGGGDCFHISVKLAEYLLEKYASIRFHFVIGRFSQDRKTLIEMAENNKNCILHENINKMSPLMLQCQIAISAGGSTTYELCACGVPMIVFSFADNQQNIVRNHDLSGCAISCGDYREGVEVFLNKLDTAFLSLLQNREKRKDMFDKCVTLVDRQGAQRIMNVIEQML